MDRSVIYWPASASARRRAASLSLRRRISARYEEEMAFAAVVGPSERERVVAASSYFLNPATGLAEVAYMVDPEWQGLGLGAILHALLGEYARKHGARGLRADVLRRSSRMMRIFERGDHSLSVTTEAGVLELPMLFDEPRHEG